LFETFAFVEMTGEIEVIVDRSVNGAGLLLVFTPLNFGIAPSLR